MKRLGLAVTFLVVTPSAVIAQGFRPVATLRTMLQVEDVHAGPGLSMYMGDKAKDPVLLLSTLHSTTDYLAGGTGFNNSPEKLTRYRIGYLVIAKDSNKEPVTKELPWVDADAAPGKFAIPALHFPNQEVKGAKDVVFYFAAAEFAGGQSWDADLEAIKAKYTK